MLFWRLVTDGSTPSGLARARSSLASCCVQTGLTVNRSLVGVFVTGQVHLVLARSWRVEVSRSIIRERKLRVEWKEELHSICSFSLRFCPGWATLFLRLAWTVLTNLTSGVSSAVTGLLEWLKTLPLTEMSKREAKTWKCVICIMYNNPRDCSLQKVSWHVSVLSCYNLKTCRELRHLMALRWVAKIWAGPCSRLDVPWLWTVSEQSMNTGYFTLTMNFTLNFMCWQFMIELRNEEILAERGSF